MREDGGLDEQEGAVTGEATTHSQDDEAVAGIELCVASHARLVATAGGLTDDVVAGPSLMPGWTVGHVLTHLARNADGHARRLDAALDGEEVPRYPGGQEERGADIEAGAPRSAGNSLGRRRGVGRATGGCLGPVGRRRLAASGPHGGRPVGDAESPWRRLREVEVHHVDLGLLYGPEDWPEGYVAWELPRVLATVPSRVRDPQDARRLMAWMIGRRDEPGAIHFEPWG